MLTIHESGVKVYWALVGRPERAATLSLLSCLFGSGVLVGETVALGEVVFSLA